MLYKKPEIKSYSASDIIEEIGPCQNQYTTTTFYTTTGNSAVNVDGEIRSDNFVDEGIDIGDRPDNTYFRSFVGFDISSIQGSTIVSATLRVYQAQALLDPYTLGTIVVDHVNFGSSIDFGDFGNESGSDALTPNIGTLSTNATQEWKTLDVTNYVQADINTGRTSSQFRLRFNTNTDSDGIQDMVNMEAIEDFLSTGNNPELVVTYR